MIPKALRMTLTPQVPVVNSLLQWEQAQTDFSLTLTRILLEYWESRKRSISEELNIINELIKEGTEEAEVEFMTTVIDRITMNVERDLSTKNPPNQTPPKHT